MCNSSISTQLDQLQQKILSPEIVAGVRQEFHEWLVTNTQKNLRELKAQMKSSTPRTPPAT